MGHGVDMPLCSASGAGPVAGGRHGRRNGTPSSLKLPVEQLQPRSVAQSTSCSHGALLRSQLCLWSVSGQEASEFCVTCGRRAWLESGQLAPQALHG